MTTIREFIADLRKRAKEVAEAVKSVYNSLIRHAASAIIAGTRVFIVPTGSGNALDAGKRYQRTSGHAPVFSLYTFFGIR